MSWLNTLIDVASAVSSLESAQTHANLNSMRKEVIELIRLTEYTFLEKFSNPKLAAYHMRLLAYRVENTWLTPDLFPQREDQETTASLYRHIRKDSAEMFEQLSVEDQAEVRKAEAASIEIGKASLYLNHTREAQRVHQAQNTVRELEERNKTFKPIIFLLLYIFIVLIMSPTLFSRQDPTTCNLGFFALVGLAAFQIFVVRRGKYLAAKKVVDESDLNIDKFDNLEAKYGSVENAQRHRMNAEAIVRKFKENNPTVDVAPVTTLQENQAPSPVAPPAESDHRVEQPAAAASSADGDEKNIIYMCMACRKDVDRYMQYCPHCGEKIESLMYRLS